MFKRLLIGLAISSTLVSCETDVEINAPWQDITVVYGLMDVKDSAHIIKINKSFIGLADAYEMAQVRDSSEYKNITVKIQRYKGNTPTSDVYTLRDTIIGGKPSGTFYGPEQKFYYFIEPNLDPNSQYLLKLNIDNGRKEVSAMTEILAASELGGMGYAKSIQFYSNNDYTEPKYKMGSVKNGKVYQLMLQFHYSNYKTDGSVDSTKSFEWPLTVVKSSTINGGDELEWPMPGSVFFEQIVENIPELSTDIKYRKFRRLTMSVVVGGAELNTYMEVNQPATGLIQEKPEYTNVENGIGIFSTRTTLTNAINYDLGDNTLTHLFSAYPQLGFCTDNGTYACE